MTTITRSDMLIGGGSLGCMILAGIGTGIIMKDTPEIFNLYNTFIKCCQRPINYTECSALRTEHRITNVSKYCRDFHEDRVKNEFLGALEITLMPFSFILTCMGVCGFIFIVYSKRKALVEMSDRCRRRREYQVLNAETEKMPL